MDARPLLIAIITTLATSAGCVSSPPVITPPEIEPSTGEVNGTDQDEELIWGQNTAVLNYDRFFISGRPDDQVFKDAAAAGVQVVVNLQESREFVWNLEAAATEHGLYYTQLPIAPNQALETGRVTEIDEVVNQWPTAAVYLYDSTGERAITWLVTYLVRSGTLPLDEALAVGEELGLSTAGEQIASRYMEDGSDTAR